MNPMTRDIACDEMPDVSDARRRLLLQTSRLASAGVLLGTGLVGTTLSGCGTPGLVASAPSAGVKTLGYTPNLVTVTQAQFQGRDAMAIELTQAAQRALLTPGAAGNGPSFAMPDTRFDNGVIEVELAAQINGKGQPDVRGFVGLAFHIGDDLQTFEAIYLRMTNGSKNLQLPPAPRNQFAVQYISYPDRYWRKLRQEHPNRYEKPAPVAIDSWHTLRLEVRGSKVQAFVDGTLVLTVDDLRFPNRLGRVGLWVDDGTLGYFRGLKVGG